MKKIETIKTPKSSQIESGLKEISRNRQVKKDVTNSQISQAIAFLAIILCGTILLSVVLLAKCNWYYPALFYIVIVVFGYNWFFTDFVSSNRKK